MPRRIAARIIVSSHGCWEWQGVRTDKGYATAWADGRWQRLHRWAYGKRHGDVPPLLDHVCHDPRTCAGGRTCPHRACLNPDHLEPATPARNADPDRRALRWAAGTCARGHDVTTPAAVYLKPDGSRECRACRAAGRRRERAA
jgi:hypothetical protein